MFRFITLLFFATHSSSPEWQNDFISPVFQRACHSLAMLADRHSYGEDSFCTTQARPLYSGEEEGLPLYKVFHEELVDLAGYEFRVLYHTQKPYRLSGCQCPAPLNYDYDGCSIQLSQEEKAFYEIFIKEP